MSNILSIVAPIFVIILFGYAADKRRLISQAGAQGINDFGLYFCLPALLIRTLQKVDLTTVSAYGVWGAYFSATLVMWLIAKLIARYIDGLQDAGGAVTAMGASFGNLGMMGLALAYLYYGERGLLVAAVIISCHTAFHWLFCSIWAEISLADRQPEMIRLLREIFIAVIKNPIILSLGTGWILFMSEVSLPPVAARLLDLLADTAVPVGLFGLGLSVAQFPLRGQLKAVSTIIALKMAAFPVITFALGHYVFKLPPIELAMVSLFAALPTGMSVYIFSLKYKASTPAVSGAIALGLLVSILTIPVVMALLQHVQPPV